MKILLITNTPFNINQGSGYGILNFYHKGVGKMGADIDAYEPNQYEFLKIMRPYAYTFRLAIGMCLLVIRKHISSYNLIVFYGAQSFLVIWLLKKIFKTKVPIIHHSNGVEIHAIDALHKYGQHATFDGAPPKWYQVDRYSMFKLSFSLADYVITNGDFDRDYLIKSGIQSEKRALSIPYGLEKIMLEQTKLQEKKGTKIGYCGTWINRKGVFVMAKAMNTILKENPKNLFLIAGVGNDFKKEHYFSTEVLERVRVYPFIKEKQKLKEFYDQLDIFLFPSYYDSFGLVLAEAMSSEVAVVTTPTGFGYGLKHMVNAFTISMPNEEELKSAIDALVKDSVLREKIGKNGCDFVKTLHWENQRSILFNFYKDILNLQNY